MKGKLLEKNIPSLSGVILTLFLVLTSGCMEITQTSVTLPSPAAFTGATTAQNLDGNRIQVTWASVPQGFSSIQINQVQSDGSLSVVNTASTSVTSYVVTGLTPSTLYSYVVRACDSTGTNCDTNHNVVSALTYAGINPTVSTGSLTVGTSVTSGAASVTFPGPGPNASAVNVYCHTSWAPTDVLAGSLSSSAAASSTLSLTLSGLYTGTNYVCSAHAIIAATGTKDGNIQTASFQSKSLSYNAYRGVVSVQAYGDAPAASSSQTVPIATSLVAPNSGLAMQGIVSGTYSGTNYTPASTPTTRQVILTWASFNIGSPITAAYKVVRVPEGGTIDMTTSTLCTPTTGTACQVCVSTAGTTAFSRTCTDAAIGAAPNRYEYAVTLLVNPGLTSGNGTYPAAEQMPSTSYFAPGDAPYRINVPIPPSYMVLVHRDSVNYEMCNLLGQTPSAPQNDPRGTSYGVYHTTCPYNGLGATPGNVAQGNINPANSVYSAETVPQNLGSTSYYDFGYNLFVDRYMAGCNWTPAANGAGGMCSSSGTSGDCYGATTPTSTQGVDGNVYYDYANLTCYVNQRGAWYQAGDLALDTAHLAVSYSISPSAGNDAPAVNMRRTPPLVSEPSTAYFFQYAQQRTAQNICQSVSDANTTGQGNLTTSLASSFYGPKRLLRRREQVAASAFPWIPGDPGQLSLAQIGVLQTGNIVYISSANANYTNLPYTQGCDTGNTYNNGNEVSSGDNTNGMSPLEWAGSTSVTNSFMIGSDYTAKCTSRYGLQDMVGNLNQWLAEDFSSDSSNSSVTFSSFVDAGDTDLNAFAFDNVTAPEIWYYPIAKENGNDGSFLTSGTYNFLAPFGFPIETSSPLGGSNPISLATAAPHINYDGLSFGPAGASQSAAAAFSGLWYVFNATQFVPTNSAGRFFMTNFRNGDPFNAYGFRCAMPAEIPH